VNTSIRKHVYWLVACVVVITIASFMGYAVKHDFGKVDIQSVRIMDESGYTVAAKIYRPIAATPENKMPGVLAIPGYQNDKDAESSFAIELSRRGFVVMAMDFVGHGDSGGHCEVMRFMFGDPADPYSIGANSAYHYLQTLPFVDANNLGIMGHSMGGIAAQKVAAMNPDVKAINPYCTLFIGIPGINNVLWTMARFDEFDIFREGQLRSENLNNDPAFAGRLGVPAPFEWDTTYGSFSDGTARRVAYIEMEHHFTTLNKKAVAEDLDWMRLALKGGAKDALWIDPNSQIFMWYEICGLIAFLVTMLALIPLTNIILATNFFKPVAQPMPDRYVAKTGTWWLFATINGLIGIFLFLRLTEWIFPLDNLQNIIPFMQLQIGNGTALWFLASAAVWLILFLIWYFTSANKAGVNMYDMGVSFDKQKTSFDWSIIGKTVLVAAIAFAFMYILQGIFQLVLGQEFRFYMAFMRQFSSGTRLGLFVIYLIPALAFFLTVGGMFLFGQIRQKEYSSPAKTQWMWWLKNLYAGMIGLFLIWAFQYLPMFLGGPGYGFEIVGWTQWSGMWPLQLQVYIPVFAFLLFLLTWFYRRTGKVYLGALVISSLWIWWVAAGSIINIG
jgi:pimeloyl-ACP methyl ester carboxylesterase